MNGAVLILCASLELVGGGQARVHVEDDGSPAARRAAAMLREYAVLMTGVALPTLGRTTAIRFERSAYRGYRIREAAGRWTVDGDDPVRAVYDLLEGWGCRFVGDRPRVPRREALTLRSVDRPRPRTLWVDGPFDPAWPVGGWSVTGLDRYGAAARKQAADVAAHGYPVAVASTTFDDFLSPDLFDAHPEWFALRGGKRAPRGNFALGNADARAAYLDAVAAWWSKHPEVDVLGLWPKVTTVWDEDALAAGAPDSYASLWREAAARFPDKRIEILATGLTLRPPKTGRVPKNVLVRFRPGREASAWQSLAGQPVAAVVRGWKARGARVMLEIDAAPERWCGLPWPCHQAVRGDAELFDHAVLVRGSRAIALLWRKPAEAVVLGPLYARLLERARTLRGTGDLEAAAELFLANEDGAGFQVGEVERLRKRASDESLPTDKRRAAARDLLVAYHAATRVVPDAARYRRYRERLVRRLVDSLAPDGVAYEVGPAKIHERPDRIDVTTDRLDLRIDRASATIVAARRKLGRDWSDWIAGDGVALFTVAALAHPAERGTGRVEISSPDTGVVRILLEGRFGKRGPTWRNELIYRNGSGTVTQKASTSAVGGLVSGCRVALARFDHWVCPAHATEGVMKAPWPTVGLPPGTLVYLRKGNRGLGLALRLDRGGNARLQAQDDSLLLYTTTRESNVTATWILFERTAELANPN